MPRLMPNLLTEEIVQEIANIGFIRQPIEACGIWLPTPHFGKIIFEMPNRAKFPREQFHFTTDDVVLTIEDWVGRQNPEDLKRIVIWHTHPRGGLGPSGIDMASRLDDAFHLVVSLHDDGTSTATWY